MTAASLLILAALAQGAPGVVVDPKSVDDTRLGLADLPAYRAALEGRTPGAATPATFRDLWDRPRAFRGRRVRVEGTVRRRFRQDAVGKLPALVETWVTTRSGDPLCLVHPAPESGDPATDLPEGTPVRFAGTFLKRVRYKGGDTDRLAPLIVGPAPPEPTSAPPAPGAGWSRLDWTVGLVAASAVVLVILRTHLRRPTPPRPVDRDPPPEFLG